MLIGLSKNLSKVAALTKCANQQTKSLNLRQIQSLFCARTSNKFSTQQQEQATEFVSDYDFILQRLEENPNLDQELLRQEDYEIIFPEDSKEIPYNDVRYQHTYMNKMIEFVTVEEHLEDFIFYMKEEVSQLNIQSKNQNQDVNSTQQAHSSQSSSNQKEQQANPINDPYYKPRYYGKTADERRVIFFNTNNKKISKNCTPHVINLFIQSTELYNSIPQDINGKYKRKLNQFIKMIFYNDISTSIPLPQMRKIIFFSIVNGIQINSSIVQRYFAHHKLSDIFEVPSEDFYPQKDEGNQVNNNEVDIKDESKRLFKLSKTHENELRFDNLIDLIIYIFIQRDKTLTGSNVYIHENAFQNIESIISAIKKKQFQFKFKSFLMLYKQLVLLYSEQTPEQMEENKRLKTMVEEISQIIFQILHQVQFAEQKIEILLLFTLAKEKEKVDFYLPVVQNHVKQNIDNLNLSEEVLKEICNNISTLRLNHEQSYHYFMNILFEQPSFTNSSLSCILSQQNNIGSDLPFQLKQKILNQIDQDSQNAKPSSSFFTSSNTVQDLFVHPTMRFQLGFQHKLASFAKLFNFIHIEDKSFIRLIRDIEAYNHQVLCEDLSFKGITNLFLTLNKLRLLESPLFANFEDHIINLLENHAFEKQQLWQAIVLLYSYALSSHVLSQKFIETSMIFLCYNMNRLDAHKHEFAYRYLTILMMKLHNKEYGPHLSFATTIRPNFGIIMHEFNKSNVFDTMREAKINPMVLKSFYYTLKIVAPEQFEKIRVAKQILEIEQYGNQNRKDKLNETAFSQEIQSLLDELNIEYEKEKLILFYYADFYLPKYNLILEANGPSHYILNTERFTEIYRLKKFHLQNEGYKIYDVSYMKLANAEIEQKGQIFLEIKAELTKYLLKLKQ